jgi:DUF4097 and DUF4098 domain-containing protein YvlB
MRTVMRVAVLLAAVSLFSILGVAACVTTTYVVTAGDFREKAERTDATELHLASGGRVRVETPYGKVHVRTTESGGGSLRALVTARGKSVEEAQARLERTQVKVDESGGGVAVSVAFKSDGSSSEPSPSVDFELLVPHGVKLDLVSNSGSVTAEDGPFADARLRSSYGTVEVENVEGDATVESSSGAVSISNQRGGKAVAKTSYGPVTLEAIDATSLRAETSSGSMKARRLKASTIELASSYGSIQVDGADGRLIVRTSSGSVSIQDAKADVTAKSEYGAVEVDGVLKGVTVHSSSGSVTVTARAGSVIDDDWRIDSNYGRVTLEAPHDLKFDLDAKTSYGNVDVGYAIEVPPGSSTKKGSAIRGKINGGGPVVTLESKSGSVTVTPRNR